MKKIYLSILCSCISLLTVAQTTFKMPCDSLRKNPMARRSMNCLVGSNDQVAVYEYNGGLRLALTLNSGPGTEPTMVYEDIAAILAGNKRLAVTCADLDGDKHDEIVLAYTTTTSYVSIRVFSVTAAGASTTVEEIATLSSDYTTRPPVTEYGVRNENGKIELHTIQLNPNSEQEQFVVSYLGANLTNKVVHTVYGNNGSSIVQLGSRIMDASVDVSQENTNIFNMEPWDVAFDDFDLDRKHELVFVQRNDNSSVDSTRVQVLKMNYDSNGMVTLVNHASLTLNPVNYGTINTINYGSKNMVKPELSTGDLNGDQIPEIVVADMFGPYVNTPTTTFSSTGICGIQVLQVGRLAYNNNTDIGPNIKAVANAGYLTGIFPSSNVTATSTNNYNNVEFKVVDYNHDRLDDIVFSGPAQSVIVKGRRSDLVPRCGFPGVADNWNLEIQETDSIVTINHADFINNRKTFSSSSLTDISVDGNPEFFKLESRLAPEGTQRLFLTKYQYNSSSTPAATISYVLGQALGTDGFNCALTSGDLSGDGYELGAPFTKRFDDVAQPTVVLCAPPEHYDCFSDGCISTSNGDPLGTAYFTETDESTNSVETSSNSAWALEASVGAGYSGGVASVSASFTASYGESFETIGLNDYNTISVTTAQISGDDLLCYSKTPYQVTEYPILQGGNVVSRVISLMVLDAPIVQWATVTGSDNPKAFIPTHEPGNIFSYRSTVDPTALEDLIETNQQIGSTNTYTLSDNLTFGGTVSWTNSSSGTSTSSYSGSVGASLSAEAFGATAEISGNYDWGGMRTSSTTLTNTIDVSYEWNSGDFNTTMPYNIASYNVYSDKGLMILGWGTDMVSMTELPTSFIPYTLASDPAWNMPWRLREELWNDDMRYQTKSIWLTPYRTSSPGGNVTGDIRDTYRMSNPEPGDTVVVHARVFNMSLVETPPVSVSFYHGHPNLNIGSNDNEPLADFVSGFTEIEVAAIEPKMFVDIEFTVKLPNASEEDFYERGPRLYAVIDPNNFISNEVHEENNIAWFSLGASTWGTVADLTLDVNVCNDETACNYTPGANVTNTDACLYGGDTCDDGNPASINDTISVDCACVGLIITGCMDVNACNYNASATQDDGSCGAALGSACDDNNTSTENDVIIANCICQGTLIGNAVHEMSSGFTVFPNPSEGAYAITMNDGSSILELEVFDVSGKKIISTSPFSSQAIVDLSNYAKGFYVLKIRTSNSSRTIRLERI